MLSSGVVSGCGGGAAVIVRAVMVDAANSADGTAGDAGAGDGTFCEAAAS
jgi:hypothetical protein